MKCNNIIDNNSIICGSNRPWWPSGLEGYSQIQVESLSKTLVRIPLEAKIYVVAICTRYNSMPREYNINCPESEMLNWPGLSHSARNRSSDVG